MACLQQSPSAARLCLSSMAGLIEIKLACICSGYPRALAGNTSCALALPVSLATYSLKLDARALKEWHKLGDTVRVQFKKKPA